MTSGNADTAFGQRLSLKVRLKACLTLRVGHSAPGLSIHTAQKSPSKGRCCPRPFKAHTNRGPVGLLLHMYAWGATKVAKCRWLPGSSSSQEEEPREPAAGRVYLQSSGESPLTRSSTPWDPCTREEKNF